jgi:hypothetical protein
MDGTRYFESVSHAYPRLETLALKDKIRLSSSIQLHGVLHGLYGLGEVEHITDGTAPQSVVQAQEFLDEDQEVQRIFRYQEQMSKRQMQASGNLRFMLTPRVGDVTDTLDTKTLSDAVEQALASARGNIVHNSTRILARSVVQIQKLQPKIAIGKSSVDRIVYDNIAGNGRNFARDVGQYAFGIDITSDQHGRVFNIDAKPRKPTDNLPAWLSNRTDWDDAVSNMIGHGMLEFDAYFALLEWCANRRLPLIPVATPHNLESAQLGESGLNTNSDILLCNLETNEIIPIQVKNNAHPEVRKKYIPEMAFITPTILGLQELSRAIARDTKGNAHTVS